MDGSQRTARVTGTGSFLPPTAVDNPTLFQDDRLRAAFDVERARGSLRKVGVGDGGRNGDAGLSADAIQALPPEEVFDRWARQVTGIRERRLCRPGDGLTTEEMCARAGARALEAAGMEASDLDLVLVATVSPAGGVPNAACTVADRLGVPGLGGFTLNGACTGYIHALATAWGFIRSGGAEAVLITAGDTLSRITHYGDPTTAVVFADGAAAAVLTASEEGGGVLGPPVLTAAYAREHLSLVGQGWETVDEPDPKLRMGGGPRVLRRAILAMADVAGQALERAGMGWEEVDLVLPHQANLRITQGLESHLTLPRGRVLHNIEGYGNFSAATVGVGLDEVLRGLHGDIPDPARIVLTAVGGGYTMAAAVLEV